MLFRHVSQVSRAEGGGKDRRDDFWVASSPTCPPEFGGWKPPLQFDLERNALENYRLVAMTLDEISDYCRLRDCHVRLGSSDTGFIVVSSGGLESSNNYGRFLALSELRGLPSPAQVIRRAELFRVDGPEGCRDLNREAFRQELEELLRKVGLR